MNDPPISESQRDELRRRWLSHAAAAFDLMFDPQYQDSLQTFDQREQRSVELCRDLSVWLLQQHVNADPLACPDEQQPQRCPKCGKVGRQLSSPHEPLPKRPLVTLSGEVTLKRQRWRCTTCRVVFFPPGS